MMPWKYIAYGIAALGLIAAIVLGVVQCKKIDQQNSNTMVNAGVDRERSQTQGEVLNRVQNASNASEHPSDEQLNVVCGKYDRNCPKSNK